MPPPLRRGKGCWLGLAWRSRACLADLPSFILPSTEPAAVLVVSAAWSQHNPWDLPTRCKVQAPDGMTGVCHIQCTPGLCGCSVGCTPWGVHGQLCPHLFGTLGQQGPNRPWGGTVNLLPTPSLSVPASSPSRHPRAMAPRPSAPHPSRRESPGNATWKGEESTSSAQGKAAINYLYIKEERKHLSNADRFHWFLLVEQFAWKAIAATAEQRLGVISTVHYGPAAGLGVHHTRPCPEEPAAL